MKYLLDTHLLLWSARDSGKLSPTARSIIEDACNELHFSAVSIWEIAIKASMQKPGFRVDPLLFRTLLLRNGYRELEVNGRHAAAVVSLPWLHRDPFDRMLVAQSQVEGMTLLSADGKVAAYGASILNV
ncbi:type II toxin-antitoxin system VapC family toxin [Lautropia mirabilis]|uniref:type II toxin-antitoxin system VapC family toxin n=1 Tax=Lautropia mirabilis TaxID=47671 RepID=UPI002348FE93|nr:type II toxin-antitoxin system VapC family toxin [Lautropia mirabilis]MDC6093026.1 type II toxin-antitoxin system VapC family toxin [Lautropia mirabilis]